LGNSYIQTKIKEGGKHYDKQKIINKHIAIHDDSTSM